MSNSKDEELKNKIAEIEKDPKKIARLIRDAAIRECEEAKEYIIRENCYKILNDFRKYSCDLLDSAGDTEKVALRLLLSTSGISNWICQCSIKNVKEELEQIYTELHQMVKNEEIKKRITEKYDECINNIERMK